MPVGPAATELAALDRAVAAVNRTRAAALAGPGAVTDAATALDAADEACATGQRSLAGEARRAARRAVPLAGSALTGLPAQLEAYRVALDGLAPAAAPLEPGQQSALTAAAEAGQAEAAALGEFATAARATWPAYTRLDEVQSTWLDRASAGWFRSDAEAAAGYVVLRKPLVPELERARPALQRADERYRPATDRMRAALDAADAALQSLRAPATQLPG